jgi:hypothetical protein
LRPRRNKKAAAPVVMEQAARRLRALRGASRANRQRHPMGGRGRDGGGVNGNSLQRNITRVKVLVQPRGSRRRGPAP